MCDLRSDPDRNKLTECNSHPCHVRWTGFTEETGIADFVRYDDDKHEDLGLRPKSTHTTLGTVACPCNSSNRNVGGGDRWTQEAQQPTSPSS